MIVIFLFLDPDSARDLFQSSARIPCLGARGMWGVSLKSEYANESRPPCTWNSKLGSGRIWNNSLVLHMASIWYLRYTYSSMTYDLRL